MREDTRPQGTGPRRVVVRDHASLHRGQAMQDAGPALAVQGMDRWDRPPYAPARNEMAPRCGVAQHRAMPRRRFREASARIPAVDQAFRNISDRLASRY